MDPNTAARFRKVCGMLGSSHDGERAAAALKATELLKQIGANWGDVAIGAEQGSATYPGLGDEVLRRQLATMIQRHAQVSNSYNELAQSTRIERAMSARLKEALEDKLLETERQLTVAQEALEQQAKEKQTPVGWAISKIVDLAAFVFTAWIVAVVWKATTS